MMYGNGLKSSNWSYNTAASANITFGRLLVSGGMFVLDDPQKRSHRFAYKGVGLSLLEHKLLPKGFQLPQIPLPKSVLKSGHVGAGGATTNFNGDGLIFYSGNDEPKPEDFEGFTLYGDLAAGVLVGYSGSLFMTGMRKEILVPFLFAPAIFSNYLYTSSAPVVWLQGMHEGLVDVASAGLTFGSITYNGPYEN